MRSKNQVGQPACSRISALFVGVFLSRKSTSCITPWISWIEAVLRSSLKMTGSTRACRICVPSIRNECRAVWEGETREDEQIKVCQARHQHEASTLAQATHQHVVCVDVLREH